MTANDVNKANALHLNVIYVLASLSVLINILFPVAVLWAFWQRSNATDWAESHYRYVLISSAWAVGLMFVSALLILMKVGLGVWMVIPIKLWFAYRLFMGVRAFLRKQPI